MTVQLAAAHYPLEENSSSLPNNSLLSWVARAAEGFPDTTAVQPKG